MQDAAPFDDLSDFQTVLIGLPGSDSRAREAARARNDRLTKPPGALGRLEELAVWFAGWAGTERPVLARPQVAVFAANHGIAVRGVSAFPAEVTAQMVANFRAGGAAINQLSAWAGATMSVHALDLDRPTRDFTTGPAMSEAEVVRALETGWTAVDPEADALVVGEMGIGNTTSAAALACALFGGAAEDWAGRGTGIDEAGLSRKVETITEGLGRHGAALTDPLEALRCLGGREIAAMAGAIAAARSHRIPVVLDGFIATAAAGVLARAAPGCLTHCVAGHVSAESGHRRLLGKLGLDPILDLGLRLGEGSGGALALGVLAAALRTHSGMATFDEAGVSDG
ncbi:nicotinate-nucleotide--dimethylbenzimidazole phosphoribosyltransferase [Wenxinia saemankumensis]|uniref:Nicotinate-nucleotide--dimethylbenzimidazole phosphoribosyltransferase n=1 Tax=Wenxinia saemankumensis TaxID=1447782 RepID=A0A1M6ESI5_9RHOB|nr:nicotinate-nucleotide--dimethylbenzimidazole phosphoribosyltransferase [Wenxinia saemankumensis]SHI88437.1 nicotinate-nucleotide-dimethylbenzimidazole phosphoribosyltransferase [Wenxinia saemankumensis]